MFDSSVYIYSAISAATFLFIANEWRKTAEWRAANDAPLPPDDDNLSGLRVGEVCMIPYGGGDMLRQDQIPSTNPVYFVEDEADARAAVATVLRAEEAVPNSPRENTWEIRHVQGMWWFACKYYHDAESLRTLTAYMTVPKVDSVQEAREYLTGLRTSGDRRGRPQ